MRILAALTLSLALSACATFPRALTPDSIQLLVGENGTCTAWAVAPFTFVTAKHCFIMGGTDGWSIGGTPVRVLALSPNHDIALLTGPGGASPLRVAPKAPPIGAPVMTYGYGSTPLLLLFPAVVISPSAQYFDGEVSPEFIVGGANGRGGMSGGPILWRGFVVSMVTGGGQATHANHLVGAGVAYPALRDFVQLHVDTRDRS